MWVAPSLPHLSPSVPRSCWDPRMLPAARPWTSAQGPGALERPEQGLDPVRPTCRGGRAPGGAVVPGRTVHREGRRTSPGGAVSRKSRVGGATLWEAPASWEEPVS